MRNSSNAPDTDPPDYLDWETWTGPAPMRPYNKIVHPRGWRAFMEYGNGIMGDMCIHMYDMARWMLELGWPKRISSTGGILMNKGRQGKQHRPNHAERPRSISATSTLSQHRTWGDAADPKYPWALLPRFTGEKGNIERRA